MAVVALHLIKHPAHKFKKSLAMQIAFNPEEIEVSCDMETYKERCDVRHWIANQERINL